MTSSTHISHSSEVRRSGAVALTILILGPLSGVASQQRPDTFLRVYQQTAILLAEHPDRSEGSPGELIAFESIRAELTPYRITLKERDFNDHVGGHSFSRTLEARIPGAIRDELLIVVSVNDRAGAPSGESRLALVTALAASLSELVLPVGVRLLFLGAERGEGQPYPMGSNQFLDAFFPSHPVVVFYLDIDYAAEQVIVRAGDTGEVSPFWLVESVSGAMESASLRYSVRGNETQFYRLGLSVNPAPLEVYLDAELPGISFHSDGAELSGNDELEWAERYFEFVLGFIIANDRGFSADWDRHYLFFQAGSAAATIRERDYLVLLIVILQILILYPLVAPDRFRKYARSIVRHLWAVPTLVALVFGLLLLGTFIVEGVSRFQGDADLWQARPVLFLGLKLSAAIFLFALLFSYVRRIPLPRRGRFYNAVALAVLYADIFVLGALNISFAYYVLWACVWAFLFSLVSSRLVKAACLLASPIWLVKAVFDVFTLPEMNISRVLILSRVEGNLIMALVLLPFLCMLIRLDFMFRHPRKRTKRILMTLIYASLGVAFAVLLVLLLFFERYDSSSPQPVHIAEEVVITADGDSTSASAVISSPTSIAGLRVETGSESFLIEERVSETIVPVQGKDGLAIVSSETSEFLGRKRIRLEVGSVGRPDLVQLLIESEDELILYDANFPYSYDSFGAAKIHIGRNPPLPLAVEFTLPASQTGKLGVWMTYDTAPSSLTITGRAIEVRHTLRAMRTFDLQELQTPN